MSTYARAENINGLGQDADLFCDLIRDQLGNLSTRTALDAWLAHPRTARFLERLQHTPGQVALWTEMQDLIAAALEYAVDDRAPDAPPPSCTIDQGQPTTTTDEEPAHVHPRP